LIINAARQNLINSVIIKPNQIGTVTETCRAIQAAQDEGLRVIVSHRSGETEDNFIIHLAKACAADGVKIGPPARERMTKFNELIRIWG
jgi:enolase